MYIYSDWLIIFLLGLVKHCLATLEKTNKMEMQNLKEAIIMIKESWKKVKKETIVNCWKRAGIIERDENEDDVELERIDREDRLKYTEALDEELKVINREEFFKQFLHPSLRTEDFIDLDSDENSNVELSDQDIVDIACNKERELEDEDKNEDIESKINVSAKEAFVGLDAVKAYIEQSDLYNNSTSNLLNQVEDLIHSIKDKSLKQKKMNEYFPKI